MEQVSLFPLNTVLFPGARLPLRIFEQRYLELIKTCLRQDREFVIVLISKGREVGIAPEIFSVGTRARIVDWNQLEDGILGVTVEGRDRVKIDGAGGAVGEVLQAKIEPLEDATPLEVAQDAELVSLLQKLQQHPLVQAQGLTIDYENLTSVVWALSSLLPFNNTEKQFLLELDDAQQRYQSLHKMLRALDG